ncbi:MAG: RNA pseudouridine synthase [Spirulina sp. SIO3F2]|nr:RNA pseudouridine synthase [Spirulina sp. SIO3F2]
MPLNQGWVYRDRITPKTAGQTALDYYTHRYSHSSCEEWRNRFDAGQMRHQGEPIAPDTWLKSGWQLEYHRPPWSEPEVPLTIETLYDDADLLVVAKPAGLPVLPGGGFVQHTLLHQLQQQYPGIAPVHRLGRGTSGVILLARSPQTRAALSAQFRHQQIQKVYRALVGPIEPDMPDTVELAYAIGKCPHLHLGYLYSATPKGQAAWSRATILDRRHDSTLLDVAIRTGRPHQIRIHLAAWGYPLLGDPLYTVGGVANPSNPHATPGDCGYWLHAHRVQFQHPSTGKVIRVEAAAPPCLLRLES